MFSKFLCQISKFCDFLQFAYHFFSLPLRNIKTFKLKVVTLWIFAIFKNQSFLKLKSTNFENTNSYLHINKNRFILKNNY